jgi:hypothetical protein
MMMKSIVGLKRKFHFGIFAKILRKTFLLKKVIIFPKTFVKKRKLSQKIFLINNFDITSSKNEISQKDVNFCLLRKGKKISLFQP